MLASGGDAVPAPAGGSYAVELRALNGHATIALLNVPQPLSPAWSLPSTAPPGASPTTPTRNTYHIPARHPRSPAISLAAVHRLPGPRNRHLGPHYRQNNGTGTHLKAAGLKLHGKLWAQAVEAWLDTLLR